MFFFNGKCSFYTFQVSSYFGKQNNHENQSIGYKNNPGLSFKVEHFRAFGDAIPETLVGTGSYFSRSCLAMVSNKSARSDL